LAPSRWSPWPSASPPARCRADTLPPGASKSAVAERGRPRAGARTACGRARRLSRHPGIPRCQRRVVRRMRNTRLSGRGGVGLSPWLPHDQVPIRFASDRMASRRNSQQFLQGDTGYWQVDPPRSSLVPTRSPCVPSAGLCHLGAERESLVDTIKRCGSWSRIEATQSAAVSRWCCATIGPGQIDRAA